MELKPIETRYSGCLFRSRLEARWAVYFDALPLEWQYEPEGFELPSGRYLPDFWLPQVRMWGEVKPHAFSDRELSVAQELAVASGRDVLMLIGPPDVIPYEAIGSYVHSEVFGVDRMDFAISRFCIDEHRLYCSCGGPTREQFARDFDDSARAVEAARSARFEYGQSGATI